MDAGSGRSRRSRRCPRSRLLRAKPTPAEFENHKLENLTKADKGSVTKTSERTKNNREAKAMKDALGHGRPRGGGAAHQTGVNSIPKSEEG